jgi:competence protein ComEC
MRRVFANSGTIHVFAISGMNIALVAGLLIVVVSALGVPRPYWVVGLAPLLFFYTFASGAQPSAMRACLMAVLYFAAPLLGRRPSGSAALAGTALAVYAWTPALVFNIGCTLSFAVMGGLLAFCTPFCRYGRELCRVPALRRNARLYEQAGSPAAGLRLRWAAWGVSLLVDSMAVSVAAWLASLPLTAYYFGRFTPGGVVANLVIAPCAFLVMVAGCLGWAVSFVSAWCAAAFNHAAGFFTVIMVWTAEVTAACPWGNFNVSKWAPWQVGAWFLALAALALWLHTRRPADGLAWLETEDR